MSQERLQRGREGEDLAETYLKSLKINVLERNYRCPVGEIDIIAQKGPTRLFIEVKTRFSKNYGDPFEAVTPAKQKKIMRVAEYYLAKNRFYKGDFAFAVIAVSQENDKMICEMREWTNY